MRWVATAALLLLGGLALALPGIDGRGSEARVRHDVPEAFAELGAELPPLGLRDLDGAPVRLTDFRGRLVLLTFERSLDW